MMNHTFQSVLLCWLLSSVPSLAMTPLEAPAAAKGLTNLLKAVNGAKTLDAVKRVVAKENIEVKIFESPTPGFWWLRLLAGQDEQGQPYSVIISLDLDTGQVLYEAAQFPGMGAQDFLNAYAHLALGERGFSVSDIEILTEPFYHAEISGLTSEISTVKGEDGMEYLDLDGLTTLDRERAAFFEARRFADGKYVLFRYNSHWTVVGMGVIDSLADLEQFRVPANFIGEPGQRRMDGADSCGHLLHGD